MLCYRSSEVTELNPVKNWTWKFPLLYYNTLQWKRDVIESIAITLFKPALVGLYRIFRPGRRPTGRPGRRPAFFPGDQP